ncbi:hypothetical protein THIAE_07450 [Thiomicrospira aerophila AL3]|uniref:HPt domain-containing protein n=1 Tax=Thiomicrospira aerophila AL3 TaxID=717772 RepID=W0DZC1_9GAMM|nr:Hpt domain-containing protein [Thiomicrospira aerophila]AHF02334.1 hypothetical protein THIAE_07450 [Thiomicrospira aerophila AL3]
MIYGNPSFPILSKDIMDSLFEEIGDETFYEALDAFMAEIGEFSAQALHGLSLEDLRVQAHSLKSSARMFGTIALAESAFELEKASKSQNQALVNELLAQILVECQSTLETLKETCSV